MWMGLVENFKNVFDKWNVHFGLGGAFTNQTVYSGISTAQWWYRILSSPNRNFSSRVRRIIVEYRLWDGIPGHPRDGTPIGAVWRVMNGSKNGYVLDTLLQLLLVAALVEMSFKISKIRTADCNNWLRFSTHNASVTNRALKISTITTTTSEFVLNL